MTEVHLLTLDPGHFHAALVQREMYAGVVPLVHIYAPLGADLLAHLNRIAGFNMRPDHPTAWELEVHAGPDSLERLLRERPGNVVVLSGRNRHKIDLIKASVEAGLHVLADKPWIIRHEDFPKLESALNTAETRGLVAYDMMTERYEITSMLQRELVNDADLFGTLVPGTEREPGVFMESIHYLAKRVAGVPLRRPAWYFDIDEQGEGLGDVGTHLVDLVMWMLFPDQPVDYRRDFELVTAERWPTVLTRADFQQVTGEAAFPTYLAPNVHDGRLDYYCNTLVAFTVRGVYTKLNVLWDFAAGPGGGDTHFAVFRGTRSRVEVRQHKEQNYRPELYVVPRTAQDKAAVATALRRKVAALQNMFEGVAVQDTDTQFWVTVPDHYRVSHEAHFGEVTNQFLRYFQAPKTLPAWEKANMLAKYFVTTQGVKLSKEQDKH
jgi:predicted dehydrogenase